MKGKSKEHHKHLHRASGGSAHRPGGGPREEETVAGNPDVFKEAEDKHGTEKKRGGRARKAGGKVLNIAGGGVRPRLDRPGRKAGGRVGADRAPLSSAHTGSTSGGSTPSSADTYGGERKD